MIESLHTLERAMADLLDVPLDDLAGYSESLLDFGLDSVQIMLLVGLLEEQGVELSFVELAAQVDLPTWWALIENKKRAQG
ncbi:phosphopantetheine-binding protein [Bermanella sp. WJH001]|uniref:phosphopantetheine-binding protein n=1 Tax=Bermanella sp. WJH001 TaxID=3048005 RepID=UPI0024BEA850|nr:phosphopantetheine-binding protein [Bermanella sp. WJH001]MDJ1539159.1 phosphopantetheine-binding protein [Bermanella sp. WJH001]